MSDDRALIRPARESDRPKLLCMHDRCGLDTRVGRWLAPLRAIPGAYLDSAVAGGPDHLALVAEDPRSGRVVGLASAVRDGGGCYELGILVEDRWQRRGVGTALLQGLVGRLPPAGARLVADVAPARRWIVDVLGRLGTVSVRHSRWSTHVVVVLAPGRTSSGVSDDR